MEKIFGQTQRSWSTFAVLCLLTLSVGSGMSSFVPDLLFLTGIDKSVAFICSCVHCMNWSMSSSDGEQMWLWRWGWPPAGPRPYSWPKGKGQQWNASTLQTMKTLENWTLSGHWLIQTPQRKISWWVQPRSSLLKWKISDWVLWRDAIEEPPLVPSKNMKSPIWKVLKGTFCRIIPNNTFLEQ